MCSISCLVIQAFIYTCGGFRNWQKSSKIHKGWQKRWSFYSKHVFPTSHLQFTKESFVFPGVTGNISEENIDLIVTEDKADNSAGYETIESSKQVISNNLFLSEFLNARYTTSKLMKASKNSRKASKNSSTKFTVLHIRVKACLSIGVNSTSVSILTLCMLSFKLSNFYATWICQSTL